MKIKTENRANPYFNKYKYRARLSLAGLNRTYGARTFVQFLRRLEGNIEARNNFGPVSFKSVSKEIEKIDLNTMERWYDWMHYYRFKLHAVLIRTEGSTAGVFSNNLDILHTLEKIENGSSVDYSQINENIPIGIKYFSREPKHKFRMYLKGRWLKETSTFRTDLQEFIERYKTTDTIMVPSEALASWFIETNIWHVKRCAAHFNIDYDDPSTGTLLRLMFANMMGLSYKLEKAPGVINTP